MSQVRIRRRFTSGTPDALSGTLLAQAGSGRWLCWFASTVDTATVSISTAKTRVADAETIQESSTDVAIKKNEDTPWVVDVPSGEVQPTIVIGGTTGTVLMEVCKVGK